MVDSVEFALVLEHHNLLPQPGRHCRYIILEIYLDGVRTVNEWHMEDFAAWYNGVLAGETVREAGAA